MKPVLIRSLSMSGPASSRVLEGKDFSHGFHERVGILQTFGEASVCHSHVNTHGCDFIIRWYLRLKSYATPAFHSIGVQFKEETARIIPPVVALSA
jgi:hypothetical protein